MEKAYEGISRLTDEEGTNYPLWFSMITEYLCQQRREVGTEKIRKALLQMEYVKTPEGDRLNGDVLMVGGD